ncbi:hypothetical protein MHUMG1_08648 [Metarhizium humberi]|uniref:Uncharacterized protein n=1 Tax=Metarhizium humberi TaxID=2596975 RepID=A0A9P8M4B6_9HYPO|nr:hypothetical protein MHUMG1_08648 [Metarhizium humberi]
MSVYSSYETTYVGLESKNDQRSMDALELSKMFSFFYRENVEFDLIKTAATNARQEREDAQAKEQAAKHVLVYSRSRTWKTVFRDWVIARAEQFIRPRTVLPDVMRDEADTPFDEDRLRSVLSLLVRLGIEAITQRLEGKQRTLSQPWALTWLIPQQGFRSFQTAKYAKFNLHLHCGCYAKAEELQVQVKDYILASLGPEFKRGTMSLKRYNTKSSSRPKNTTVQIILQLCRSWMFLAPLAYRAVDRQQLINRRTSNSKIVEFGRLRPEHKNTWRAVNFLSKVRLRYFDNEEAWQLQLQAYEGLERILSPTPEKILEVKDNLAGIYGFIGKEHLPRAHQMSDEAVQIRLRELGSEHPLTHNSKLTLAKIKTAMNQLKEAQEIFLEGLMRRTRASTI